MPGSAVRRRPGALRFAGLAVDDDARAEGHGALVCPDQVRGHRTEGFRLEGSSLVQLHVGQPALLRAPGRQREVVLGPGRLADEDEYPVTSAGCKAEGVALTDRAFAEEQVNFLHGARCPSGAAGGRDAMRGTLAFIGHWKESQSVGLGGTGSNSKTTFNLSVISIEAGTSS